MQLPRWALLILIFILSILCYGVALALENLGGFLFGMAERMVTHGELTKQKIERARK